MTPDDQEISLRGSNRLLTSNLFTPTLDLQVSLGVCYAMKPLQKYLKSYCKWKMYLWFFILLLCFLLKMLLMDYRIANKDKMLSGVDLAII